MKKILNKLREKNGDATHSQSMIFWFLAFMVLAIFISVFPVFIQYAKLQNAGNVLMEKAIINGNTSLSLEVNDLKNTHNMDFNVDWSGTQYISGTTKIQLKNKIKLKLTYNYNTTLVGQSVTIPLNYREIGSSERYFK